MTMLSDASLNPFGEGVLILRMLYVGTGLNQGTPDI